MSYRKRHIKSKLKSLRPKRSVLKNKWFWMCALGLIFIFSFAYLFFFFSGIQVSNIQVLGSSEKNVSEIKKIAEDNFTKKIFSIGDWQATSKNIFLANINKIDQEILKKFPNIKESKTKKKLFKTLNISIIERMPAVIFCAKSEKPPQDCYFADESGIIFEYLSQLPENFPVIKKQVKDGEIFVGKKVIGENIIDAIKKTEKLLKDNFNINLAESLVASPERLDVKTSENWQIYFNTKEDLDLEIAKLKLILESQISESARKNLQYIDLRFKDRAYYK